MRCLLVLVLVVGLFSSALMAQKVKPTGHLVLDQISPRVGDVVTFTATVANLPDSGGQFTEPYYPWVYLECEQGAAEVLDRYLPAQTYNSTNATFRTSLGWTEDAANCKATLFYARVSRNYTYKEPSLTAGNTLDVISFGVLP